MRRDVFFVIVLYLVSVLSAKDFRKLVRNDITIGGGPERVSMKREYEIYSKVTGNRIRIRGKKIDANGAAGSVHAKMEISSISFGGVITIKGAATGRYICMNKKGKLITKRKARGKACRFVEAMGENYFDTFTNVRFPSWLLAFQPNGRPKKGPKTAHGQTDVMFLTFLKRPKHERSLLSTSSPSTLDKETWQELEERIRSQFLSNPHLEMDETITTMTNTPLRTSFTTDAPEIRNELEARRKVLIKVSSINSITTNTEKRKKKRPKRRKSRKSKKKNKSASKVTTIERRESLLVSDSFTTSPPILRISTRITAQETYRRTKPRKHSVKLGRRREHRLSNIKPKPEFDTT